MPNTPNYEVRLQEHARAALKSIKDTRVQKLIVKRAKQLALEPDKQGKPLSDDLAGCRSVRAVGQRYRIIYQVQEKAIVVLVVMLGLRKEGDKNDVYAVAGELAALGLLSPTDEGEKEI